MRQPRPRGHAAGHHPPRNETAGSRLYPAYRGGDHGPRCLRGNAANRGRAVAAARRRASAILRARPSTPLSAMTQPPAEALLFEVPHRRRPPSVCSPSPAATPSTTTRSTSCSPRAPTFRFRTSRLRRAWPPRLSPRIKAIQDERLYTSAELTDAVVRLKQLAYLSTASAGHGPQMARELTALAPEAVLDSATRVAREIRRRHWSSAAPPDKSLSAAQHTALHEIVRGHVVVTGSAERQYVHHRTARVLISTLRSLESKGLIARKAKSASPAYIGDRRRTVCTSPPPASRSWPPASPCPQPPQRSPRPVRRPPPEAVDPLRSPMPRPT